MIPRIFNKKERVVNPLSKIFKCTFNNCKDNFISEHELNLHIIKGIQNQTPLKFKYRVAKVVDKNNKNGTIAFSK